MYSVEVAIRHQVCSNYKYLVNKLSLNSIDCVTYDSVINLIAHKMFSYSFHLLFFFKYCKIRKILQKYYHDNSEVEKTEDTCRIRDSNIF